jgi:dihydrofolate reductase
VRKGGTTFHFVAGGLPQALDLARRAANGKDVRICGGADTIGQAFEAGVVDDLTLHVAPILLGKGLRLFEGVPAERFSLRPSGTSHSPQITHLHFSRT